MEEINNRIGGSQRAQVAREQLVAIFSNQDDNEYLLKDIDYANKYSISRHTVASIREQFKIPSRSVRILIRLKTIDTKSMTINEISEHLNVKYQNLYKIIQENGIDVKPDTRPIEHLKIHAKQRRQLTIDLIERSGIIRDIEKQLEDINIILPPERTKGY